MRQNDAVSILCLLLDVAQKVLDALKPGAYVSGMDEQRRKGGRPRLGDKGRIIRFNVRVSAEEKAWIDRAKGEKDTDATLARELIFDGLRLRKVERPPTRKNYANPTR